MKKYALLAWMLLGIISAMNAAEQFVTFGKASAGNALLLMGTYTNGEPKVKYRGIFINDE